MGQESLAAEGVQRMGLVDREHRQRSASSSAGKRWPPLAPGETVMVRWSRRRYKLPP